MPGRVRSLLVLALLGTVSEAGCSHVRPWQREDLASPVDGPKTAVEAPKAEVEAPKAAAQ